MEIEYMTIFYRKANGEIKAIMSDACDMSAFGEEQEDYELIWDYIVLPVDEYVRFNLVQFYVDLETKTLKLKQNINLQKYL
jgi:hypothetical protein